MCAGFFLTFPLVFYPPSLPISRSAVTLECRRVRTSTPDLPVVRRAWSRLSLRKIRSPPHPPAPIPSTASSRWLPWQHPHHLPHQHHHHQHRCRHSLCNLILFIEFLFPAGSAAADGISSSEASRGPRDGDEGSGLSGNDVQSGSRQRTRVDAPQTRLCRPRRGNIHPALMKAKLQWKRFYKVISGGSGQQRHAAVCQAGDYASRYQTVDSTLEIMEINCITCPNAQTATSPVTRLIQPQRHPVAAVDSPVLMAADGISVTSWRRSTAAGHLQGSALFCFLEQGRLVVGIILRVATAE